MRTALLIAATLICSACYTTDPTYDRGPVVERRAQAFEAYTTQGDHLAVAKDARTGDLFIVEPRELRGQRVAIVDRAADGRPIVTRDVPQRSYQGAGGDAWHRDNDHDDDDVYRR